MTLERKDPYYIQFYHLIKQMIFEGKFQPGERINETHLAKEYNVSKSPVREAIRILEKEGLLVVDKAKVVVYEPSLKDVEDIYYCRMALESFAVKLTTRSIEAHGLEEIRKSLEEAERAITNKAEPWDIILLNEKFHQLILTFSQNKRLKNQVNELRALNNYFRILNFSGKSRAQEILEQHKKIFYFIEQREPELAAEEMVSHLEKDVAHLLNVLRKEKNYN